jgi:hypothetical protein
MKHLKTFESFNTTELVEENWLNKITTSITGTIPDITKLVAELDEKKSKYADGYNEVKKNLEKFSNLFSEIKEVKSPSSDQRFPFTEENFLAIAGYFNFNVGVLRPIKQGEKYIIQMTQRAGVGSSTGHSR